MNYFIDITINFVLVCIGIYMGMAAVFENQEYKDCKNNNQVQVVEIEVVVDEALQMFLDQSME